MPEVLAFGSVAVFAAALAVFEGAGVIVLGPNAYLPSYK